MIVKTAIMPNQSLTTHFPVNDVMTESLDGKPLVTLPDINVLKMFYFGVVFKLPTHPQANIEGK